MRCWPCSNSFEHCTISGCTDSADESVPNRRSEWSVDDFDNFFVQMDAKCDVYHLETVLNIVRFPDAPNRPSNRYRIDDHTACCRFSNFFYKMDIELDIGNFTGRGFNLSALFALLPLVGQGFSKMQSTITFLRHLRNFFLLAYSDQQIVLFLRKKL